jgi:hypothetical protein
VRRSVDVLTDAQNLARSSAAVFDFDGPHQSGT